MSHDAQEEIVAFLSRREGGAAQVRRTHISIVVLGADRAYKLKRPVVFPYLDFSTPQKRLAMCAREVALNRRLAPSLYLGARRVTREASGALALDGDGDCVDAVVEMRRFDEAGLFENLAAEERLDAGMIDSLASLLARFHAAQPADFSRGGAQAMRRLVALCATSLRQAPPAGALEIEALLAALGAEAERHAPLLEARRAAGKIRPCHGDLTLRNICLFEGVPTPFDCLEFSDDLATIDCLYDLAFLLMDLWRIGARDLANLALNRYLDALDETDGLPLLPFFMALRAAIRAHVAASQEKPEDARRYFEIARDLLHPRAPTMAAVGGLSGSGKSSLAARIAPRLGAPPGARVLNSDRLRKKLFGVAATARLPESAYAAEVSAQVYADLFEAARKTAAQGWSVVADAVFDRAADRAAIERIALNAGLPFHGFWLDADFAARAARVAARRNDVSDATRAVLERQAPPDPRSLGWRRLDAARRLESVVADASALL